MKEIYLAMDADGTIIGCEKLPILSRRGVWCPRMHGAYHSIESLQLLGIDVTAFPLTHETPIKIRAKWEVCDD